VVIELNEFTDFIVGVTDSVPNFDLQREFINYVVQNENK
jgi:hypothetical protein